MRPIDHDGRNDRPSVAVIIPFYQRREGLLRRAVSSALDQDGAPPLQVIVVDDASPFPAEDDLADLSPEDRARVTVLHQENAGPGAARNTGLDHLPDSVEYVAFLDSDDEWLPGHLGRAVAALDTGFDLFFSNYRDIGQEIGGFEARGHLQPDRHEPLEGIPDVYAFRGDLRDAILSACPVETSTVVFRRAAFEDLRFRPAFRDSYEDHMFWFEMAVASERVVFSAVVGTQYGTGVNLYRGLAEDSVGRFRASVGSTKFRAGVRSAFSLTSDQSDVVDRRLERDRRAIAGFLLHRLRRFQPIPWSDLVDYVRAEPRSRVLLPWAMCRHCFARLTRRERGADPVA